MGRRHGPSPRGGDQPKGGFDHRTVQGLCEAQQKRQMVRRSLWHITLSTRVIRVASAFLRAGLGRSWNEQRVSVCHVMPPIADDGATMTGAGTRSAAALGRIAAPTPQRPAGASTDCGPVRSLGWGFSRCPAGSRRRWWPAVAQVCGRGDEITGVTPVLARPLGPPRRRRWWRTLVAVGLAGRCAALSPPAAAARAAPGGIRPGRPG